MLRSRRLITTIFLAAVPATAGACGSSDLPGPTRGTWHLDQGVEGRSVTVTDTTVRIHVEAGAFGSATLQIRTTEHEVGRGHERVQFDRVFLERFASDTVVGRLLLARDSAVLWRPDRRQVFTSADSVLSEGGRLVLVPGPDSSLRVGLPSRLLRGEGGEGLGAAGTLPWPDSGAALDEAEGWTVIHYRAYRP